MAKDLTEKSNKVNISFDKSTALKLIVVIISLISAFFAQSIIYKPRFGTMIDSDMDSLGNLYTLSVDEKSAKYKVTKIATDGKVIYELNLEKPSSGEFITYRNLEVDPKGNFFIVQEIKDTEAIVANSSQYPITKEKLTMYDTNGKELKTVASHDFSAEKLNSTSGYIKKIQIANQKLSIICSNNNSYDIYSVNPYFDESPVKSLSFNVSPPTSDDYNWVNDISVLSNGNVVYSTKSGDLFLLSKDGSSSNCKSLLPTADNSISSMYVDRLDHIFFVDLRTGNFYSFDTNAMNISLVHGLEDEIKLNDLKIKDLRKIRPINENDFFASSKTFVNPYYVRFGSTYNLISDIRYKFWPLGLAFTILGAGALVLVIFLIMQIFKIGIKRTYVSVKASVMFLPVFLFVMSSVVALSAKKSLSKYTDVLRQNQSIGAKIVSEKIDGNSLPKMLSSSNYMSNDFASMKISLQNAYNDLKEKVGDNSDYIVVYLSENGKIYSITNNKHSGSSKYYDDLKFADPDMTQEKISLVDTLLERDEIENIYSIWTDIQEKNKTSVISLFRDIHGDLSACFVPIKNSEGNVIGMIGNFLDERAHVKKEFFSILREMSIFVGATSILILAYLCLVVWFLLRPMRTLNHGINVMINGHWKNRVPIVSKDEFARISVAFNNMSDKLEMYTNNLMDLNSEYLRFVPKRLLKLIGKDKITSTNVGDGLLSTLSIVYITFNIHSIEDSNNVENNLFLQLKQTYSDMFDIVSNNKGVVQNFSSLGATLLFNDPYDALNSSLQIFETKKDNIISKNMRISIGLGPSFVGLIGNDVRRGVTISSLEMQRLIKVDKGIDKLGVSFIATNSVIEKIKEKTKISFRFIGRFKDILGLKWENLYQVIDNSNTLEKENNIRTKSIFERAVQLYIDGEYGESRKLFVEVLNYNKNDSTALYYINLCDIKASDIDHKYKLGDSFEEI